MEMKALINNSIYYMSSKCHSRSKEKIESIFNNEKKNLLRRYVKHLVQKDEIFDNEIKDKQN